MLNSQLIGGVMIDWDKIDRDSYLRNIDAISHVDNIKFTHNYDESTNTWRAGEAFFGWWASEDEKQITDDLVLTRDEVMKLKVDCNTNKRPEHGYIYDSTEQPGTPF